MDFYRPQQQSDKKKDKKKKHNRSHSQSKKKKKSSRERERERSRSHKKKDKEKKHKEQRSRDREDKRDKQKDKRRDVDKSYPPRERERSRSKKKKYDDHSKDRDYNRKDRSRQDKYQKWRRERDGGRFRFDSPPKSDQSDMSDDPEKMDKLNKMKAEKQLVTSKADRKLYLGNLPPNITSNQLMQMLNSALKKMEINSDSDGDSIVSSWISPDGVGHYAFVEFRTAQEATSGLALNGASLYGYQLKLGRPKQYIEYHKQLLSEFGTDGNIDTILKKVSALGGFAGALKIQEKLVNPPSRVIVLRHIVNVQELAIDEQFNEIVQDITEMAKRHGDLLRVLIPRPQTIDLQAVHQRVKGLGYIFIKYRTIQQARYARKEFIKQMFSERSVACSFFPQRKFEEGELDVTDKIVIDF